MIQIAPTPGDGAGRVPASTKANSGLPTEQLHSKGSDTMSELTEEARKALLALYASIDAEGGAESDEGPAYHEGFSHGLELALTHIDMMLNADREPDHAWIEEGWKRFSAAMDAQPKAPS